MECPNCSFQNRPGLKHCVRCQGSLEIAAVDYLPPRASGSPLVRAFRRSTIRAMLHAINQAAVTRRYAASLMSTHVNWSALAWSIVPGMGHIRTGHRLFGRAVLSAWIALVLVMLAFSGGASAWFWYLVVVGFHCFVVTLLLSEALQRVNVLRRLMTGLLIYATLTFALYLPARWLARQVVVPVQISGI